MQMLSVASEQRFAVAPAQKSDTGETRIFPFDETVQVVDKTFHALTFNQLKPGEKVTVKPAEKK